MRFSYYILNALQQLICTCNKVNIPRDRLTHEQDGMGSRVYHLGANVMG